MPQHFLLRRNQLDAELVRIKDVAVRQHHRVADLPLGIHVVKAPHHLAAAHDEDVALMRLAGIHKVVLRQACGRSLDLRLST